MKIKSINPYTEEVNWTYDSFSLGECRARIENSRAAFLVWSLMPVEERAKHFTRVSSVLRQNTEIYAEIITKEMGKPIRQSRHEIEKCAQLCDYYAENAARLLKDEIVDTGAEKSYVTFEPLGIIFGIMPWNFPFWQVFRFAVPAMCAGNVCVIKHASNVPKSALEIEKVFIEAGFPENVFSSLLIDSKTAMQIIKEELVDGVSLTGSIGAGSEIGELAGGLIKPLVLELGGSDPFIVLEDADIEKAAQAAVRSRFLNAGQSCIAAKRLIVVEDIVVDFIKAFERRVQELKIGDPMDEETDIGPIAKKEFIDSLDRVLRDAKKKGAKPHIYGEKPERGFFFNPVIIPAASIDMEVCNVEVFGPIAPIITVEDENEAVEIANSTIYGLAAKLWSQDLERAERLAKRIKCGSISINGMIKSDPRLPFGGVKKSGVGRELSQYGFREFVNIKTVVVNK
ncbi:MAG: NAD-dependent succinate-semialdehyde dehydrogenase [Methanosarcina flavescens]|jgi:succinate-semialdehyde dehydrogenase/glutarate-semialdehyde dehydrogenase|uniref:NAD-dependent succinate-semialdehyde dehydrogenase n=1 Tax=Methanosarcina flavescens TaxID=1715806 RepID=A0A660HQM8_9EURY|nr:NAD-dependent succinate-semialdehyde dehydrogenase [Methanosarcina flavescens]AYK14557.1 NAD-dependent succinate-semialdehyde dehydrogenase [Methanosarcina flavescens]NLK33010.1 NAD-dependent succinate-semialdehyde dehydrogenase [Methanosarcina flavescens]